MKTIIDLIQKECNVIVDNMFKDSVTKFKPYVIISQMYKNDYILTLVCDDRESLYNHRQSEKIHMSTNLEKTIELLYNRTT